MIMNFIGIFRILSKNNSKKFNGTTYYIMNNPLVQYFLADDGRGRQSIFEVIFTSNELQSVERFCKETELTEGKIYVHPLHRL